MKLPDPDEKIFSLEDIGWLFRLQKKKMLWAALLCAALALLYCLIQPVKYHAEATFKESAERKGSEGLLGMLGGFTPLDGGPQAAALMKSNLVLKPIVSKCGLQIGLAPPHKFVRIIHRLRDNVRIARGASLDDPDEFRFSSVLYEGEQVVGFQIRFSSPSAFIVSSQHGEIQGRLGERVSLEKGLSFCLTRVPEGLRLNKNYHFSTSSWVTAVAGLRNSLSILHDKANRSICILTFSHRDRHFASEILNTLMAEYQSYLKEEHDRVAEAQLAFLSQRQSNLYGLMEQAIDEHMDYLRSNCEKGGFLSLEEEMRLLSPPHAELFRSAFQTDFALELIERSLYDPAEEALCDQNLKELQTVLFEMESKRDLLKASLSLRQGEQKHFGQTEEAKGDLERVRSDLADAREALSSLEKGGELPFSLDLRLDPNRMVQCWARRIAEGGDEKEDLALYLRNLIRLYAVQEKVFYERQFQERRFPEFEGIDVEAAQELLAECRAQLDKSRESIEKCRHFSQKLGDPAFEIASLNAIFDDPVSEKLLRRATEIHLALSDEESHSEKEEERYGREMALQRKILSEHLRQMAEMEEILSQLSQDKIGSLEQVSIDKMQHQISLYQEKSRELLEQKKETLVLRKELLQKKMGELRAQMAVALPEKWRVEQMLRFKAEMGAKMMESIGQLVESKTIGHHLHHVESKPLDASLAPVAPHSPKFALLMAAGAFFGSFGSFGLAFFQKLYAGFPARMGTLQGLGLPVAGPISFACDGPEVDPLDGADLETLRKWILAIDEPPMARVIALLGGQGPNYSYALAHLLTQSQRRVLLIRSDFASSTSESDAPGLLQLLDGVCEEPPVRERQGYFFLTTGGTTRFGAERIATPRFAALLERLRPCYDHILLFSRAELAGAECEALLRLSDKAAATAAGETIEMLTPLARKSYHEGQVRLTFFISNCL